LIPDVRLVVSKVTKPIHSLFLQTSLLLRGLRRKEIFIGLYMDCNILFQYDLLETGDNEGSHCDYGEDASIAGL
jgi:hypothetical protein